MAMWTTLVVCTVLSMSTVYGCSDVANATYYDAFYDLENGKFRDYPSFITQFSKFTGAKCNSQGVLKIDFNKFKRVQIDVWFTNPSGWTLNLGDSSTNNGYAGDASTQSNDAELQLVGSMTGYLNDYGGSGQAFSTPMPSPLNRLTLLVGDQHTTWIPNTDPTLANYFNSVYWYQLNSQPDKTGPVNNDLYLGVNRVIYGPYDRVGTGVCKVGLKFITAY